MHTKRTDATAHAAEHKPPRANRSRNHRLIAGATLLPRSLALGVLALSLCGCTAALDAKISAANAEHRNTSRATVSASRTFTKAYRALAEDKHTLQAAAIDHTAADFFDRFEDADGRLVSTADDGTVSPIRREDIEQFIRDRDEARERLTRSIASHAALADAHDEMLSRFEVATTLMDEKSADWDKAKAEMREAGNAALSVASAAIAFALGGL